eukprot:896185_1
MKYAFQAVAALSAGAFAMVKAQEARKQEQKLRLVTNTSGNLRSSYPVNSEKNGARRLQSNCGECHVNEEGTIKCQDGTLTKIVNPNLGDPNCDWYRCGFLWQNKCCETLYYCNGKLVDRPPPYKGRELQGSNPSHGRLLVAELIESFTEVCPFDPKGIPGAKPMTNKFVAPEMDKDNCDCCISDHHGGDHWTKKTLSKFLQEDFHHGMLPDDHASQVASRIVKTHCPKKKKGKTHKVNKSAKSKGGKGAKGGESNNEDIFD